MNQIKSNEYAVIRDTVPKCPKCGASMELKMARLTHSVFLGCPNWRRDDTGCTGTRNIKKWLETEATVSLSKLLAPYMNYGVPYISTYNAPVECQPVIHTRKRLVYLANRSVNPLSFESNKNWNYV